MEDEEVNKIELFDEGHLLLPMVTKELEEYMRKIRLLSNQHRLNEDKTDLKPSAVIRLSHNDLL